MLKRRYVLMAGVGGLALLAAQRFGLAPAAPAAEDFEIKHTDAEWHALLTSDQYAVLRQAGTERPFTSPLDHEHRAGAFACAGCQLQAFSSQAKFDSHTGWPSFWAPLENAVATSDDHSFGILRTEVHCRRCGGHLGHVFNDGPPPTGRRYCMNGIAMNLVAIST